MAVASSLLDVMASVVVVGVAMDGVVICDGQCHVVVVDDDVVDGNDCSSGVVAVVIVVDDDDGASLANGVDCGDDDDYCTVVLPKMVVVVVAVVASDLEDGLFLVYGTHKEALDGLDFQLKSCSKDWGLW